MYVIVIQETGGSKEEKTYTIIVSLNYTRMRKYHPYSFGVLMNTLYKYKVNIMFSC